MAVMSWTPWYITTHLFVELKEKYAGESLLNYNKGNGVTVLPGQGI